MRSPGERWVDPERWARINELFHAARERAPESRGPFLDEACADDPSLKTEVESLLTAHDRASRFERPAYEAAPELLGDSGEDPLPGSRLGPYRVLSTLGRGGMGVVYLGEDTRLRRPVAIKTLPSPFTHDEHLRARLTQEAMTAAALSHPGIATVYALDEIDGHLYLVREYVAGHTLREMLADGPLSLPLVLTLAVDIATALAAALARGVIHRDLKPENVMRTPEGIIKVLDFGLARFQGRTGDTTKLQLTKMGAIIGTPGYMSPEQLRGDRVDARTDQFSFGVLLYELTTGRHPFPGREPTAMIAQVMESAPDPVVMLREDCPAGLAEVIHTCLGKSAERRFSSTDALRDAVSAVRDGGTPVAVATQARPAAALTGPDTPTSSLWWWQFHQVAVSAGYVAMLYPFWLIRDWLPGTWGEALFGAAVAVVGVTCNLRLHLWFTSRVYPDELDRQRRDAVRWRSWSDGSFVTLLLVAAGAIAGGHGTVATLFVVAAITVTSAARLVEPATTRAAFGPN